MGRCAFLRVIYLAIYIPQLAESTMFQQSEETIELLKYINQQDVEECTLKSTNDTKLTLLFLRLLFTPEHLSEHSAEGKGRNKRPALECNSIKAITGKYNQHKNHSRP